MHGQAVPPLEKVKMGNEFGKPLAFPSGWPW